MKELDQLLIDGYLVPAANTYGTTDPSTEWVIGEAADGDAGDMDRAIEAARAAFDEDRGHWTVDPMFRARCLRQLRDALLEQANEMRELTIREVGAPRFLTYGPQLDEPVADLGWIAELVETYPYQTDLGTAEAMGVPSRRYVLHEPAGVVAAITPFNFPHQINLAKLGPALGAGNTVVLKAAPEAPWCAAALAKIIAEQTEIPAGVVNVVTSSDPAIGEQLVTDPRVDLISFTGSTAVGQKIMALASNDLKRVFLELGGKSASVVLDDADYEAAVSATAFNACIHAGQGCALTTRLVVPRDRYDYAVEIAAQRMSKIGCKDPRDPSAVCGPLISEKQRERVESYLALAQEEGGSFACGGRRGDRERGFYIEPTVVTGLTNAARTAREEIFGPVLVVLPHDGDDDALHIANDSPYGLSGAVWSGDLDRARAFAGGIRSGTVSINGGVWYAPDVPFGGFKQSGIGREMGIQGFETYLETKSVVEPA